MKAKMIAVAVAGMLVGCGGGGSFESAKGDPLVQEELPSYGVNGPALIQQEQQPYHEKGPSLVQEEKRPLGVNGPELIQEQRVYAEAEAKGPSLVNIDQPYHENGPALIQEEKRPLGVNGRPLIQGQTVYAEQESKGPSTAYFQDAYTESTEKEVPAFNEVEELAICQREGLQDQESCQSALSLINSGMSEAKGEFDKNPAVFQNYSNGVVLTAENTIKRAKNGQEVTYPEVIEYLVNSTLEEDTFENRYTAAGYAIATYYYVRGIPEGHTKTGNPGLCADKGFCGDEYLKYQWN